MTHAPSHLPCTEIRSLSTPSDSSKETATEVDCIAKATVAATEPKHSVHDHKADMASGTEERSGASGSTAPPVPGIYNGMIEAGKRQGRGTLETDEYLYEGDFVNDLFQGYGRMDFADGDRVYEGEWMRGKRHGFGKYVDYSQGFMYVGTWDEGKPE